MTPLLLAVDAGHIEAATFLIQQKVDINPATANAEKTALHFAIIQQNEHLMDILLQNGADPNVYPPTVNNGKKSGICTKFRNPLSYCVNIGWLDGIQLLLKHNADVNSNWLEGGTALHIASTYSRQGAARLLLENGARTDIWDGRRAPLHSAAAAGDKEVLEALLEYGADPNERDLFGLTALDIAKQEPRSEEAIRILEPVTKMKESGWKIWKSK
jgi:ankyrin repeat protein